MPHVPAPVIEKLYAYGDNLRIKPRIGVMNAMFAYVGAGSILIAVFVILPIAYFFGKQVNNLLLLSFILIGIVFSVLQFLLSFFVKCPNCGKAITVSFFKKPHPNSNVDSGTELALKWFSGKVCCIHCGKKVDTTGI